MVHRQTGGEGSLVFSVDLEPRRNALEHLRMAKNSQKLQGSGVSALSTSTDFVKGWTVGTLGV